VPIFPVHLIKIGLLQPRFGVIFTHCCSLSKEIADRMKVMPSQLVFHICNHHRSPSALSNSK